MPVPVIGGVYDMGETSPGSMRWYVLQEDPGWPGVYKLNWGPGYTLVGKQHWSAMALRQGHRYDPDERLRACDGCGFVGRTDACLRCVRIAEMRRGARR